MKKLICKIFGHKMPPNDVNLTQIYGGNCERCGVICAWYRKTGKQI